MAQVPMPTFADGMTVHDTDLEPLRDNILDHETRVAAVITSDAGKVPVTRQVATNNGLQGGGDLSANRTLSPLYGTAANTVAQGNDSRIVNGQAAFTTTTNGTTGNAALGTRVTALEGATTGAIKWTKTSAAQTTNSTTPTAVGSSQSVTVASTSSTLVIIANFDVAVAAANTSATPGGANTLVVKCLVDGVALTEQLLFASQSVWRGTAGQTWVVTGKSAGSHTVSFTCECTGTAVTYQIAQTHTGATLMVIN